MCAAHKRGASQNLARLLGALLEAAGAAAERAATARGKGDRTPLEWLPRKGEFYAACEEVLVKRQQGCLGTAAGPLPGRRVGLAAGERRPRAPPAVWEPGRVRPHARGVAETLIRRPRRLGTPREDPLHLLCGRAWSKGRSLRTPPR